MQIPAHCVAGAVLFPESAVDPASLCECECVCVRARVVEHNTLKQSCHRDFYRMKA